jgi:hypothetical protein
MTVSTITVDRRELLLTLAAGLAATATAGIAIAAPADADPIFAAMDAYREAIMKFDAGLAKWGAEGAADANWPPVNVELSAMLVAERALMDTAPTTLAGLRAFESYLLEDSMDPAWCVI